MYNLQNMRVLFGGHLHWQRAMQLAHFSQAHAIHFRQPNKKVSGM